MKKEELLRRHTDYDDWVSEWSFYARSYFGGKRYRDGDYLIKHSRESDNAYTRRKSQAYYYNYCRPVVDTFVSLLYKRLPTRNYGAISKNPLFNEFLKNADLEGNTYEQFIREAQRYASIYGRVSVIIYKPTI